MDETIEAWATRRVADLTAGDWKELRTLVPGVACLSIGVISREQFVALLTRRDAVAAGLDEGDRVCLALSVAVPWVDIGGHGKALGLIDERGKRTVFGGEVHRVLETEGHG